jgi:hypothetical protein
MGIGLAGQRPRKQGEDASVGDVSRIGTHVETANDEARRISLRTRDALAAYRADRRVSRRIRAMYPGGVPGEVVDAVAGKLGASLPQCRNLNQDARLKGARSAALAHKLHADEAYIDLAPRMVEMRDSGLILQGIADALNAEGRTTRRGAAWNKVQVRRVLARIRTGTARVLA